jgi:hypothetical protein
MMVALTLGCKPEKKPDPLVEKNGVVEEMESPAGASSSLPHLVANGQSMLLSWVEQQGDTLTTFLYAELIDGEWQQPNTMLRANDWFVNWADYPMIAENQGNLWSHVLKKSAAGTYSYDVKMNVLPKGGTAWKTDLPLHTDGTPTEHGFVSVIPLNDNFFVTWLDGRHTMENEAGERGAMTLRAGSVSTQGEVLETWELDARTCDCCQTTAVNSANGPVVIYRDRSPDEIRDIYVVRQVQGEWTDPKPIYTDDWQIKGCPVNGPRATAMGNNLAVAWFTGAQQRPRVQVIFSEDGGATFEEPILIAEGKVMGRVDVVWLYEKTAAVSWMETQNGKTTFNVVRVTTDGTLSKKHVIAEMDSSRKSGFPQMEVKDAMLYVAWTEHTSSGSQVRTARIAVDTL